MSVTCIKQSAQRAIKEHDDGAYEFIRMFIDDGIEEFLNDKKKLTDGQKKVLLQMLKDRPEVIKKGELYISQYNKQDGLTFHFKAKILFHKVCIMFGLYDVC